MPTRSASSTKFRLPLPSCRPALTTTAAVAEATSEREIGESKMSGDIVREAFLKVGVWGLRSRWAQLTGRGRKNSA